MPTNTDPTTMTPFGDIPLSTKMATAAETVAVAAAAAQTAVASITDDLQDLVSRTYKYVGSAASIAAITYPSGKTKANGDVWNITGAFTLDGLDYPAGTDVAWIADASETGGGHWNALGGRTFDDSGCVKEIFTDTPGEGVTPGSGGVISILGDNGAISVTTSNSNDVVVSARAASTSQTGVVQLSSSTTSTSTSVAATASAVKTVKDSIPAAATATPSMDGTAAVGTSTKYAKEDHAHPTDTSRAPTSHASSSATYGAGTSGNYGHVKLSDATDGTAAAASGGTAATPKAVAAALAAAKAYADALPSGGVTSVNGETGSVQIYGNTLVMGNADPTLISTAIDNARQTANGASGEAAIRIKKATVKGKIDTPPATLANLPANAASLTLNQILNALYAGASESEA